MVAHMKQTGIYVHVPFCDKKCPYCDFYSKKGSEPLYDAYTAALQQKITASVYRGRYTADTLYFGGGTPGLLGGKRLSLLVQAVRESFALDTNEAEVTVEVNPTRNDLGFETMRQAGVNRISIGLQSAVDEELRLLGRHHTAEQALACVRQARNAGFENISLDLMIALPGQTKESLKQSVDFCAAAQAEHISAYILKIEPHTLFYRRRDSMSLPDDDQAADLYEYLCELMRRYGYAHYEISNFCKNGRQGKHNLKYWRDEEYLGFGPSAHSFIDGKRFYCPRSMEDFEQDRMVSDGDGGSEQEYIMLALRLAEGLSAARFARRFGYVLPRQYYRKVPALRSAGLVRVLEDGGFALTEKGFLVSNAIIAEVLDEI